MSITSNEDESELLSNYQRCPSEIQHEIRELAAKNARTEAEIEDEEIDESTEVLKPTIPSIVTRKPRSDIDGY